MCGNTTRVKVIGLHHKTGNDASSDILAAQGWGGTGLSIVITYTCS